MKKLILPVALFTVVLDSCSKYQMNTISSTNAVKNEETGNFNIDNDSVKISYSFYGVNAPVNVKVYNKLDKPLYVDWSKSALIIGQKATSYVLKDVPINGTFTSNSYNFGLNTSSAGNVNASAPVPQNLTFIPPHTEVDNMVLHLTNNMLELPGNSNTITEELVYSDKERGKYSVAVKAKDFTKDNTPLSFKSYITLVFGDGEAAKRVAYQQDFYVSKSINISENPKDFERYQRVRGDYFLATKKTGYGNFMTGVASAAALGATAALSSDK